MKQINDENTVVARIERSLRAIGRGSLSAGVGDDAALWRARRGHETILTSDWFLEGTHFLRDWHSPDVVGWKCLARAVSDIAAMGGKPRCFLLSLAVPRGLTGEWLDGFLRGLRRASSAFHCELAGGDTTRQDKVLISITVVGEVERGHAVLRSGARPGDLLFVSGTLGEAELGLRQLRRGNCAGGSASAALRKHLYPQPRLALGQWLATERLATAMMDLSDGLSTDLPRLCAASGAGARIDADSLPLSTLARVSEARGLALHGGDDYELLFAVKRGNLQSLPRRFRSVKLTPIGEVTSDRRILLVQNGKPSSLRPGGWDPFRRR